MIQLIYLILRLDFGECLCARVSLEGSSLFMFGILAGLEDFSFDFVFRS